MGKLQKFWKILQNLVDIFKKLFKRYGKNFIKFHYNLEKNLKKNSETLRQILREYLRKLKLNFSDIRGYQNNLALKISPNF